MDILEKLTLAQSLFDDKAMYAPYMKLQEQGLLTENIEEIATNEDVLRMIRLTEEEIESEAEAGKLRVKLDRKEIQAKMIMYELIKRPAKIALKYKKSIEDEYGVAIDEVEFWNKYYASLDLTIENEREELRDENIIKRLFQYATEEKEKFESLKLKAQAPSKCYNDKYSSFVSFFPSKESFDFTISALKHFCIIDENRKYLLGRRKEGQIAGFIDALISNKIFPAQSDKSAHEKFCKILGIEYKRFKRDSAQYDKMKAEVDRYCKQHMKNK